MFLKILLISQENTWSESLFNKVAGPQTCNFIKNRLQLRRFPMKFAKFLRTPVSKNTCKQLLLIIWMILLVHNNGYILWISSSLQVLHCFFHSSFIRLWHRFSLLKDKKNRYRRSYSQMFFKVSVRNILAVFTGKHLSWSLYFLKKRLQHRCFPVNIA